jgi:hypothetical protein
MICIKISNGKNVLNEKSRYNLKKNKIKFDNITVIDFDSLSQVCHLFTNKNDFIKYSI